MSGQNYVNVGQFDGQVVEKKECKRKSDGSVWGHSLLIAQMGRTCEFIVEDKAKQWDAYSVNDEVTARYHLEQRGYDLRVVIDDVQPIAKSNAKAA